jgi:hypothetical protein
MDRVFDAAWAHYYRDELCRRYGAGTYVAIADGAVIHWGADENDVGARAEQLLGEPVYVCAVSSEPFPNFRDNMPAVTAEYDRYEQARAKRDGRRFELPDQAYRALQELDILGQKTEFVDGVVLIDSVERRYADHDYRLMVERGIVPADTVLVAGVIYRRPKAAIPIDAANVSEA